MKRWIVTLLMMLTTTASATMLPPQDWQTVLLADGSELEIRTLAVVDSADVPALVVAETRTGATVTESDGHWFYVGETESGLWTVIRAVEGEGDIAVPAAVIPEVRLSVASVLAQSAVPERTPYRYAGSSSGVFEQPLLVVRVAFADQAFTYSDAEIAQRFFASSDSVAAYFDENSYQQFRVVAAEESSGTANDGVVRVTLSSNHPDFGSNYSLSQTLAREVLSAAASAVDASAYDRNQDGWLDPNELGLVIMVAGYEQAFAGAATTHPRVWAHKTSLYQGRLGDQYFSEYALFGEQHQTHLATIGVICHELGHLLFDLPDLYDATGSGSGVGRWGLMGVGGWNRESGYAGERPAHMLGWSKQIAGFIHPDELVAGVNNLSLRAVSDADDIVTVELDAYRHGERLMLEHRYQSGFDAGLPGSGVLVSRVNDRAGFGSLATSADLRVLAIEEADGRDDLVSNTNLGEASDVFSSAAGQILLSSAADSTETGNVELLAVDASAVADLTLDVTSVPAGDNLGLDDLPANAVYGSYGGTASVRLLLDSEAVIAADGVDVYALGAGTVTLSLADDEGNTLLSAATFAVTAGWNRLLFANVIAISNSSQLELDITSVASGSYAPLAIDAQGMASGQTLIIASDGSASVAPFDVSARLLVQTETLASPGKNVTQPVETDVSGSSGGGSSGGGFLSPLWLLALLLWPRRKLAV